MYEFKNEGISDPKIVYFVGYIISSPKAARSALTLTQPPTQWLLRTLFLGVKWLRHKANHPPPPNAGINNEWSYPHMPSWYTQG